MLRGIARIVAVATVVAGALWYVTAPPKGVDGFRERSAATAETLRSQIQSDRLWIETLRTGDATHTASLVGFAEAEQDAAAAASQFESYEPPSGTLELRATLSQLSTDVTDALAAIRIAAEQERWDRLGELAGPLPQLAARLQAFEERAEP